MAPEALVPITPPIEWLIGFNVRRHGTTAIYVSPDDGRDWGIPYAALPDDHQDEVLRLAQLWAEEALDAEQAAHDLAALGASR